MKGQASIILLNQSLQDPKLSYDLVKSVLLDNFKVDERCDSSPQLAFLLSNQVFA